MCVRYGSDVKNRHDVLCLAEGIRNRFEMGRDLCSSMQMELVGYVEYTPSGSLIQDCKFYCST
jgi:hypothetical protein